MGVVLLLWLGIIMGSICTIVWYRVLKTAGVLKIDHSNPEKDVYRFDIYDLNALSRKKRILLKVDNNADLSHE